MFCRLGPAYPGGLLFTQQAVELRKREAPSVDQRVDRLRERHVLRHRLGVFLTDLPVLLVVHALLLKPKCALL